MDVNTETDSTLKERVNEILDSLNALPEGNDIDVNRTDILFTFISIMSRVMSIISTILLALSYYNNDKIDHFTWTLCCFIIPMFVTMFLQLSIYCEDRKENATQKLNICEICWSVILFPIAFRYVILLTISVNFSNSFGQAFQEYLTWYWKTLVYTIKCKRAELQNDRVEQKKWFERLVNEDSDVALVRIFECFLEAAPQKILQITIVLSGEEDITVPQMLSLCSSMFSMAWCIASYHRCIRLSQLDKINISWIGSIVQSSWHLTITVSRILSIAIVASIFPKWTLVSFSVHAIVMGLWVFIFDRSPFCSNTWIHSLFFSLILGFVFIFNYILPKSRQTRYRYAIFYTICFLENIICVVLYVNYSSEEDKQEDYFLILCILSIVPFIVGVFFMILYYLWFHPNLVSRRNCREREMNNISPSVDPAIPGNNA